MSVRCVLLDALGTLVRLEPPGPPLQAALERETGVDVGLEAAERAFGAEIGFYMGNQMRGGTPEGLEALRDDCAAVLDEALGIEGLDRPAVRRAMLSSLTFTPFDDVVPALRDLGKRGIARIVVSNWDRSLPEFLASAGLDGLIEGAVSSAEVGAAKPDPAPLLAGLEVAGVGPADALFVGDSPDSDLPAAAAAGVRGVLVDRDATAPAGADTIPSLAALPSLF